MTREIKFRAWDKEKKEMLDWETLTRWVNPDGANLIGLCLSGATGYEFELMQDTNIKDKNGIRIHDGDILDLEATNYKNYYVVEFKWGEFKLYSLNQRWNGEEDYSISLAVHGRNNVIIGNIYENPELLK
jgi:uncharacterized phage protein (TIGR01671 family)